MKLDNNCLFVLKRPPEELSKMHLRTDFQENKSENYTPLVNVVLMRCKHHDGCNTRSAFNINSKVPGWKQKNLAT